jgi:hypothetical protein
VDLVLYFFWRQTILGKRVPDELTVLALELLLREDIINTDGNNFRAAAHEPSVFKPGNKAARRDGEFNFAENRPPYVIVVQLVHAQQYPPFLVPPFWRRLLHLL